MYYPAYTKKRQHLRRSVPVTILGSIAFGLTTAYATKASLLVLSVKFGFTLSAIALSSLIWPLIAFAIIAYTLSILNTIREMCYDEGLREWLTSVRNWLFTKKENESTFKYVLRVGIAGFGLLILAGLAVIATLATFGMSWSLAKKGALLIPALSKAASVIRDLTVVPLMMTNLIFSLKNYAQSVHNLLHTVNPLTYCKQKYEELCLVENDWQICNPFRFIAKIILTPLDKLMLLCHAISAALISVIGVGHTKAKFILPITMIDHFFVDEHYVAEPEGKQQKDKHHSHESHKEHNHFNPLMFLVKAALFWLLIPAAVWDCYHSQKNIGKNKKVLTILEAIKKSYDIPIKEKCTETQTFTAPTKSPEMQRLENLYRCKKQEKRLKNVFFNSELAKQKARIMKEIRKHVTNCLSAKNIETELTQPSSSHQNKENDQEHFLNNILNGKTYHEILSTNRIFFFKKTEPKALQVAENLLASCPRPSVCA